jgi:hypothetical protein
VFVKVTFCGVLDCPGSKPEKLSVLGVTVTTGAGTLQAGNALRLALFSAVVPSAKAAKLDAARALVHVGLAAAVTDDIETNAAASTARQNGVVVVLDVITDATVCDVIASPATNRYRCMLRRAGFTKCDESRTDIPLLRYSNDETRPVR